MCDTAVGYYDALKVLERRSIRNWMVQLERLDWKGTDTVEAFGTNRVCWINAFTLLYSQAKRSDVKQALRLIRKARSIALNASRLWGDEKIGLAEKQAVDLLKRWERDAP